MEPIRSGGERSGPPTSSLLPSPSVYLPLQLPPLFLILLVPGLEIPLKLALECLHVDLQPQFGIFGGLQLILQLFQLRFHLLHLGL